MSLLAYILTVFVALLHFGFMFLEMFFWNKPTGRKIFGLSKDFAEKSKSLAMNQGLYNGFLATGLVWGLVLGSAGIPITIYFLCCVIIAGIFGAVTVNKNIIYIQALPALAALITVFI